MKKLNFTRVIIRLLYFLFTIVILLRGVYHTWTIDGNADLPSIVIGMCMGMVWVVIYTKEISHWNNDSRTIQ